MAALSFALGFEGQTHAALRFTSAGRPPSLVDEEPRGVVAVAYLDGLRVVASERRLLGYVEIHGLKAGEAAASSLRIYGASANSRGGQRVGLYFRAAVPVPAGEKQ